MAKLAKRALYLAWQAAGSPIGLGYLQDKPWATEEDVWNNMLSNGDYLFGNDLEDCEVYADYVFGRMLKIHFTYDENGCYSNNTVQPYYQAWGHKYPTYEKLFQAAKESL